MLGLAGNSLGYSEGVSPNLRRYAESRARIDLILTILSDVKPESTFSAEGKFTDSQLLDSVDLIRLVAELDEAFEISIRGEDMIPKNFDSVASVSALVQKHQEGNAARG